MRVFRLQSYPGTDAWANLFCPTLAEGKKALDQATEAELPARLDELEIENGREGLCDFLNQAIANHMNQEPSRLVDKNF